MAGLKRHCLGVGDLILTVVEISIAPVATLPRVLGYSITVDARYICLSCKFLGVSNVTNSFAGLISQIEPRLLFILRSK